MKIYLDNCCLQRALDENIEKRAKFLKGTGIKPMDALHLAFAEEGGAHFFCTSDESFLKKAKKFAKETKPVSLFELMREIEK